MKDRNLTLLQSANIVGVTRQRMWQLLKAGRIKGASVGTTGNWVIPEKSILDFAKLNRPKNGSHRY
jgi:predicted DNA-binding protein (UPF0251 family)